MKKPKEIKEIINDSDGQITVYSPSEKSGILTTIKIYQTIYDQITSKKQKIQKNIYCNYELLFQEIDQLNIKINQLLKQYHIISKNCCVI